MDRRDFLKTTAASVLAAPQARPAAAPSAARNKQIAAISTTYFVRSHSDNFVTRLLEGYWINDRYFVPPCDVASLFVEQEHDADISTRLSRSWGVTKYGTIKGALTLGGEDLAVDGDTFIPEAGGFHFKNSWMVRV